ncbi:aminotransferase class III-fold pyridoxal phosphate-dependent enzyme [Pseudodesulfovibrio cashew]|uniref:Taurine--pyruvate aminotransferase n=1 Tax=Pseudodesulfovibrio cashew TaxID=2678688 RepID=A0A6I6JF70_9BACT|nr:aminotransferase class III-fold pyridoxal phosphate-dependent enzyme [Pseudodesulfovibrio cashew]QGY38637.1 aminotransferase class III-fold pyridoxal phosphate-dependent enzyme [Pseudodesulfovibrio cashew]
MSETYDNDRSYVLHSWSVQGKLSPKVITKGEGVFFWDENGKRYYDMGAQLVNLNIGHQHPKVVQAIKDQADKLAYVAPQFAEEMRGKLAKRIIGLLPEEFGKCFFTLAGADANENALKIARAYTGKSKIVARYRSYHGATYGAIALTGDPRRPPVEPAMPGVVRAFDPYCYRCTFGQKQESCNMECAEHIREIIQFENPDTVAAVFMESITGSNGIFPPPKGYMERVREICDEFNVLLICDEVMTGFGRTGKWFGFQNFDIVPDIITMAKGVNSGYVPLGVVAVNEKIAKFFDDTMLYCGLTYSGHPVSCAAALACIDAYEEEGHIDNAAALAAPFAAKLDALKEKYELVGDVRSIGLFGVVEMVKDRETREPLTPWNGAPGPMAEISKRFDEKGISAFVRWNYIFLTPPVIISEAELNEAMAIIDDCIGGAQKAILGK